MYSGLVAACATFAYCSTAAVADVQPSNGEIVERAAANTAQGTSHVAFYFAWADWRELGWHGAGIRDFRNRRGFVTMQLDFQANPFVLRMVRRWLAEPRLTTRQARTMRFDVVFDKQGSHLRIKESSGALHWRTIDRPKEQFIFSSLAALDAGPLRTVRWLRMVSRRVVAPVYGRHQQVRGIDTTQYDFEIDPARAARALLPFFPTDQSRRAALAQLKREIASKQIRMAASVWIDGDGRLRRIIQGYQFPEPGNPVQQAAVRSQVELFKYGTPFHQPRIRDAASRHVPPFPGFATTWRDLVRVFTGGATLQ